MTRAHQDDNGAAFQTEDCWAAGKSCLVILCISAAALLAIGAGIWALVK